MKQFYIAAIIKALRNADTDTLDLIYKLLNN